jgi:ketosteroid isomerase-like protein
MRDRSDAGGLVIAIGLLLIVLLSIGGLAGYFIVGRQQAALAMQADRARMAEAQARMAAEEARAQAEAAAASHTSSDDIAAVMDQGESIRAAVEAMLDAQEEAWNRGDLDAFMEHYWRSDDLTFSSGGNITRGWAETLQRYRERYPTRARMGQLTFSELEIMPLGASAALVLGRWNLERESEPVAGNFSLVVRKFDDRWRIVHDHTSQATDQSAPQ